jgi:hypothetical protein
MVLANLSADVGGHGDAPLLADDVANSIDGRAVCLAIAIGGGALDGGLRSTSSTVRKSTGFDLRPAKMIASMILGSAGIIALSWQVLGVLWLI